MRGVGWFVGVLLATLTLIACTIMNQRRLPGAANADVGDADGSVSDGGPGCTDDMPFGTGRPLAELNTAGDEFSSRLSPDERTIYFDSYSADAGGLFQAKRATAEGTFDAPVPILPHLANAHGPTISASGLRLYFSAGDTRLGIHLAERTDTEEAFVTERQILGGNAAQNFGTPFLSEGPGGSQLYLNRQTTAGYDLLRVNVDPVLGIDSASLSELPEINSEGDDYAPWLSPDRLTLYFTSNREDVGVGGRIFVARRRNPTDAFGAPKPLGDLPQPADGAIVMGSISADNCRIYYTSCQTNCDLFVASRSR